MSAVQSWAGWPIIFLLSSISCDGALCRVWGFRIMFAASNRHRLSIAVLCAGLLLIGLGGLRTLSAVGAQRAQAVAQADNRLARALAPATADQTRAIREQVRLLLANESGTLFTYVTVRDASGLVVASAGRYARAFEWLPSSMAPTWRAWCYRALSTASTMSIKGSRPLAVSFGLSWPDLLIDSLLAWIIWPLLVCLGIICVARVVAEWRKAESSEKTAPPITSVSSRQTDRPGVGRETPVRRAAVDSRRRSLFSRSIWRQRDTGGVTRGKKALPMISGRGFEVIGIRATAPEAVAKADSASAQPTSAAVELSTPSSEFSAPRFLQVSATPQPLRPVTRRAVMREPMSNAPPAVDPTAAADSHVLSDQTLDLRFYPIWRGADRRVLAGAWAALAWRRGDGEIVDPGTLVRLAEQEGALRAFTQWIAERFAMLHANWRTLELLTVPIVLPIPSALLAFADAEDIWHEALSRIDHDPDDLLLQIDAPDLPLELSPPVRRAIVPSYVDGAVRAACDLVFVRPGSDGSCVNAERALADTRYPMLVGPLLDPAAHAALLGFGERVAWFSNVDNEANVYTPRAFARLMSQCAVVPL